MVLAGERLITRISLCRGSEPSRPSGRSSSTDTPCTIWRKTPSLARSALAGRRDDCCAATPRGCLRSTGVSPSRPAIDYNRPDARSDGSFAPATYDLTGTCRRSSDPLDFKRFLASLSRRVRGRGLIRRRHNGLGNRGRHFACARRVAQPFLAAAERSALGRSADAAPPFRPPLCEAGWPVVLPRPEPDFLPPPLSLLTVAHARRSASLSDTPRFS